jgi:hypothetical protein
VRNNNIQNLSTITIMSEAEAGPEILTDLKLYSDAPGAHHVLKDVYGFFGTNTDNSVAVYIGLLDWKKDLQLLETYAIPAIVCDPFGDNPEWAVAVREKRGKLMDWMKYLKESDCAGHFVNPKWIEPVIEYPGTFDGSRDLTADTVVRMSSWGSLLKRAYALRNRPEVGEPHFALCRIELYNEEINVLSSLLASKYRPSLIYVRWSQSPDKSQQHCEAAGNLQSCGYRLISVNRNGFFFYQYMTKDIYSCCSWTEPSMNHPMIDMMRKELEDAIRLKSEEPVEAVKDDAPIS